ncbi:SRPBCC family protein [Streptococcus sp. zg-JUN1979]|uniref:SRPBCC family protein n=1 Tax=Streptococcus sp. zg-JUN1979 TaxID=3391450 RepID=UPI0039A401B0
MKKRVIVEEWIDAPIEQVFDWFYKSENFKQSPIVFSSKWRQGKHSIGARRDIIMIAGWYFEEITAVSYQRFIRYRVIKSFPKVRQDFTEIAFVEGADGVLVRWTIDVEVPIKLIGKGLSELAGKVAGLLYRSIIRAGKRVLETNENS